MMRVRPIKLEIEGFQSFKERQIIDFEKLCECGIFGIFGETGSGKSSILDAIILALYDEIPKEKELPSESEGLKNFLNNSSDKMEIYFKFALDNDIFEISRKYALGKTKGVDTLKKKEVLMKKNNVIIAEKSTQLKSYLDEEFGLSVDDFMRTVVLPQGKFSEFLKLKGTDKKDSIARIFNMEEYGKKLKDRANLEKKKLEAEKKDWESQKENIEWTSSEDIKSCEKSLVDNKILLENLINEKKDFDIYYTEVNGLKNLLERYNSLLQEKKALENLKEHILSQQTILDKSLQADEIKEYISKNDDLEKNLLKSENDLKIYTTSKEKLEKQLNIIKAELLELDKTSEELETKKGAVDFDKGEYQKISNAYSDKKIILAKEKTLEKYRKDILHCENQISIYQEEIKSLNSQLENNQREISLLPNTNEESLEEINSQVLQLKSLLKTFEENQKEKKEIDNSLVALEEEKEKLEKEKITTLENLETLEKEKIKNLAFELSKTLEEGKPCPVCGSIHHVTMDFSKTSNLNLDKEIKNISSKKDKLIGKISEIIGTITELTNRKSKLDILYEEKVMTDIDYKVVQSKVESLTKEIEDKKQELQIIKEKGISLQNQKIKLESDIKNTTLNLSREEKNLSNTKLETETIQKEIETISQTLDKIYIDISLESLEDRKITLEENQEILENLEKEIKENLNLKNKKIDLREDINSKLNIDNVEISRVTSDINHLSEQIKSNALNISLLLEKYNFIDKEDVKKYYLKDSEKENLKKEINEFNNNFTRVTNILDETEKNINGRTLSDDQWQEIKDKKENLENSITKLNIDISDTEKSLVRKRENLIKIQEIDKQLVKVSKKLAVAEDIYTKLRTKDFVSFLVDKKLKNVVAMASQRLNKISNGRYQLTSDESSNFYVVDFFNEGKRRRTATLSGGETFVVSLCLALALSKQLQLKGKRPLEFFFLDEGFGSLDSKLLDKVMDSIENIRSEEKIKIGIITHLEELKLRVLKRIQVEKAIPGERGSKIKMI